MSLLSNLFGGPQTTSGNDIKGYIDAGAIILDVRTEQEFAEGNIEGAVNIPVQVLAQYVNNVKEYNKPVVVYCRSGGRAGSAIQILNQAGVTAYNAGGLSDMRNIM